MYCVCQYVKNSRLVQDRVKATYVEVDFTLQLAKKAQKDSRDIALLFFNFGTRWGGWLTTRSGLLPLVMTQYPFYRWLVVLQGWFGRVWKNYASISIRTLARFNATYLCVNCTYILTAWCRVLLEKLTGLQLVKKFPAFHGTRMFITALTSVRHLSLSWATPIQSIYPHPTLWISILIVSTHLLLGLPSGLLPSGFPTKTLYTPLSSPIRATCPAHLIVLTPLWVHFRSRHKEHYFFDWKFPFHCFHRQCNFCYFYHVICHNFFHL